MNPAGGHRHAGPWVRHKSDRIRVVQLDQDGADCANNAPTSATWIEFVDVIKRRTRKSMKHPYMHWTDLESLHCRSKAAALPSLYSLMCSTLTG